LCNLANTSHTPCIFNSTSGMGIITTQITTVNIYNIMYDDLVKKKTESLNIPTIVLCPYCRTYEVEREVASLGLIGGNIRETVRCKKCNKEWYIIWSEDHKFKEIAEK